MTSQQEADVLLAEYQAKRSRLVVVRPDKPMNGSEYERDLDIIRRCMERTS